MKLRNMICYLQVNVLPSDWKLNIDTMIIISPSSKLSKGKNYSNLVVINDNLFAQDK